MKSIPQQADSLASPETGSSRIAKHLLGELASATQERRAIDHHHTLPAGQGRATRYHGQVQKRTRLISPRCTGDLPWPDGHTGSRTGATHFPFRVFRAFRGSCLFGTTCEVHPAAGGYTSRSRPTAFICHGLLRTTRLVGHGGMTGR